MIDKFAASMAVAALLGVAFFTPRDAAARGRGRGGNGAQQARQQMIAQFKQRLTMSRHVLAEAEAVINEASHEASAAQEQVDSARKSIGEARSSAHESDRSRRTLEADILAAQAEDSDFAKANLAFTTSQHAVNAARERLLGDKKYLAAKEELKSEPDAAMKIAKLQHDALEDDAAYQRANDKFKAARLVLNRIKSDLFKANADWVAAAQLAREAHGEESKANGEATRGAIKKMPAMRTLHEAEDVAAEARMSIAQSEAALRGMGVPIPKPAKGDSTYTATASSGK